MYVPVRTSYGKDITIILATSTGSVSVLVLKKRIEEVLNIKINKQRLFFRGKQLEDNDNITDYHNQSEQPIQLYANEPSERLVENANSNKTPKPKGKLLCNSSYFRVGDYIDGKDATQGTWHEGKVTAIFTNSPDKFGIVADESDDGRIYQIKYDNYPDDEPSELMSIDLRPRAREIIDVESLRLGDHVMVNYNIEEPYERGFWYDMEIRMLLVKGRKTPYVKGTIFLGPENTPLDNNIIRFRDEIMKIEPNKFVSERTIEELELMQMRPIPRINAFYCLECSDDIETKCHKCGCNMCGKKHNPDKQVVCEKCFMSFHISCLQPPLTEIPQDEWYCQICNNEDDIVETGGKMKDLKKKSKLASLINTKRDSGNGKEMACVGRTKTCSIVPPNHFGPIPGVEVGTTWKFRVQVSEAGVHRPLKGTIHGHVMDGVFSIVLCGGYEYDMDFGEEFHYTGSGGRDLSGNKRTTKNSVEPLTKMNKVLALNCNAQFNIRNGAEAKNWQGGKPIRVIRSFRAGKHSNYAPKEGNRYDGVYKVVKYYPEKDQSGYDVWKFVLKRDDPSPAPWTIEGQVRIESLGLNILFPVGYLAAVQKEEENANLKKLKRFVTKDTGESSQEKRMKVIALDLEKDLN